MLDWINQLDYQLLKFINSDLSFAWGDWFFPVFTDLHKTPWFQLSFILPFLALWIFKEKKKGFLLVLLFFVNSAVTDFVGSHGFKKVFERPRPFVTHNGTIKKSPAGGYSFVSNHAANSVAMANFIGILYPPLRWPLFTLAGLVGYSRVYNGVHYPSDVVIGGLLGLVISFIFGLAAKRMLKGST